MRSSLRKDNGVLEIKHLFWMAEYYERLGCVGVAGSLRDLAAAKEWRAHQKARERRFDLSRLGLSPELGG